MEKMRIKKIAVIILAVVVCLFALLLIQCRKYVLQNIKIGQKYLHVCLSMVKY